MAVAIIAPQMTVIVVVFMIVFLVFGMFADCRIAGLSC
jgi:hypothetical protein